MKGLRISILTAEANGRPGEYSVTEFEGGLPDLQAAVGGLVEPIPTNNIVTMWANDEGKFHGLPINRLAMDVWLRWDDHRCMTIGRDWIAGDVVVTGGVDDRTGRTLDLTETAARWVLAVATDAGATIIDGRACPICRAEPVDDWEDDDLDYCRHCLDAGRVERS